ncbi:MAG: gamma-glutamyl-gamma-aminobutyrate hydrolase family protein [Nanoarchaeota archaeon]|nr:gamma-glutamyl-gamma-aminobutyrate hydrolase family protein [Nanoarchaeota archaeon]
MILLINNHSIHTKKIARILRKHKVAYVQLDQSSLLHKVIASTVSGVILSGGTPDLDEQIKYGQIRANIAALLRFNIPILGICEGHEIIAEAYGAELLVLPTKHQDHEHKTTLKIRTKIFKGLPRTIEMYEAHSKFVKRVSPDFFIAASSRNGRIEAMFHKKRPIYSVQFHPEKSGEYGEKILMNFVKMCKK